ncbi:hypothetical protein PGT21_013152 [Puccinia graminis f. sp. tritici]|uniref:Uncharacterized protein n=1 Tax=Puccinia graminis f. sp. tritici TaxID=56615 RepID=A0A5B0M534_PUCGR|nr:hypothetical protein PGT21_013152 [Puccinia graminis f. sp. tritici]
MCSPPIGPIAISVMPFDPGLSCIQAFESLSNASQLLLKVTHLLGFKFSHFQKIDARNLAEATPP